MLDQFLVNYLNEVGIYANLLLTAKKINLPVQMGFELCHILTLEFQKNYTSQVAQFHIKIPDKLSSNYELKLIFDAKDSDNFNTPEIIEVIYQRILKILDIDTNFYVLHQNSNYNPQSKDNAQFKDDAVSMSRTQSELGLEVTLEGNCITIPFLPTFDIKNFFEALFGNDTQRFIKHSWHQAYSLYLGKEGGYTNPQLSLYQLMNQVASTHKSNHGLLDTQITPYLEVNKRFQFQFIKTSFDLYHCSITGSKSDIQLLVDSNNKYLGVESYLPTAIINIDITQYQNISQACVNIMTELSGL